MRVSCLDLSRCSSFLLADLHNVCSLSLRTVSHVLVLDGEPEPECEDANSASPPIPHSHLTPQGFHLSGVSSLSAHDRTCSLRVYAVATDGSQYSCCVRSQVRKARASAVSLQGVPSRFGATWPTLNLESKDSTISGADGRSKGVFRSKDCTKVLRRSE